MHRRFDRGHHAGHHEHHHHHDHGPRWRGWLVLLGALGLAYLATGIFIVQPNQRAVVRRCGRMLPQLCGPGLHFGLPYGFDRVDRIKMQESKRVGVGVELTKRAVGRDASPQEAECLTGDRNLILVSAVVQYRIADAKAYLFHTADVPALVANTAAASLASVIASMGVDDVLTVERITVQNEVLRASQEALDGYRAGVQLTSVVLEEVAPPEEVAEAFRDVTSAREDMQRTINEAQGYANRLLPQTRGEAQRLLLDAQAYAEESVQKARGDADRFEAMAAQLSTGRSLTIQRLVLETMEDVLPRLKKLVLEPRAAARLDLGIVEEGP